ncbi:Uncharacterized protein Rs2_41046 [Raphanus sativus]|nr:Uncharacterized protein Rs2_41046 [Raphanus sativus]
MQKELELLRHKQKTLGSIDGNQTKSIDRRFIRLEDKMYSLEETLCHSYYLMSDDMAALSNIIDALKQEMETIQKQIDSQQTHPPIYTPTPISVVYPQEPTDEHTESIDAREVASSDCYINHDRWNPKFHYKPKYGAIAHDTHMGQKRSWSDTSEDPANQRRRATYTQEEVDKMISKLYTVLEDAEEEYTRQFDAVYESFNDNFDTLYPRTERLVKDITDIRRQLATQP